MISARSPTPADPDAGPPLTSRALRLRLLSYNVHAFKGLDGEAGQARIANAIVRARPDVVCLQEVLSTGSGKPDDHLAYLAIATGLSPVMAATERRRGSAYGNALLTALPIARTRIHDISIAGREPRNALDVDLRLGEQTIRVINTHLGLSRPERYEQVSRLLHALGRPRADAFAGGDESPLIVAGDFNEWSPFNQSVRRIDEQFGPTPRPRTYPTRWPLLPLDRVWTSPRTALRKLLCPIDRHARRASDHLPLLAELEWQSIGPAPA